MTVKPTLVAGLDIGTTKTCAVIGAIDGESRHRPEFTILGVGQAKSHGIRRGAVAHIDEAAATIRSAVTEAELMAGVAVEALWVSIAGNHIGAHSSHGVVAIGGREVTREDLDQIHEVARAVALPGDREFIHEILQEYVLDQQVGIENPVGMSGVRLEADVLLASCSTPVVTNIRKAISKAGHRVEALVPSPLAAARAVLSDDEKALGVAMVGIGGATTDLAVYREGKVRHMATLVLGGDAVTRDLVRGLALPFADAERAKAQHAVACVQLVDPMDSIELPGPGPGQTRQVSMELMAHIVEERLDELFGLVHQEFEKEGLLGDLGAGVVVTGGTAALHGIAELASRVFPCPVRVGIPSEGLLGLAESVQRPRFATATGLCIHGADSLHQKNQGVSAPAFSSRIWAWIREFF